MSHRPMGDAYDPWTIEATWRQRWADDGVYTASDPKPGEAAYYCLDFFPYPSGAGLSVGHGRNYVPSDAVARYHRMRGQRVLHPMGWDAFGLPAENEAMKQGVHPVESTRQYAANYKRQLDLLGCSYDWSREINSSDPAFYRWNQLFFLMLYRRGLAYRAEAPVNWCETCQTVLAAEMIEHGTCWRCHRPVVQRRQRQWFVRTTAYADELYAELDNLDWPDHILAMQRHWIGRREGLEIDLQVVDHDEVIPVFTSRSDTYFGVTFVVLAPEHEAIDRIVTPDRAQEVRAYCARTMAQSAVDRQAAAVEGVDTGAVAELPGGERVPIYVAGYVLVGYGTGAVMGVPAHDARDHAFAQQHGLQIRRVIVPAGDEDGALPFTDPGMLTASGRFDGMSSTEAQDGVADWLIAEGTGRKRVHYRLRDWLVSRQRYWGTPIPFVHCSTCGEVPVSEEDLPVLLPDVPDYRPRGDGRSPLANVRDFVETTCPRCGGPAERETDTMTGFVCSSWYYLRFTDPHNAGRPFDPARAEAWMPADVYVGGAEHAVGHLMYARFWSKFLADEGWVSFREPLPCLRSQGVLHARDPETGKAERMSKSKGNVITPESVIDRYGADVTRLHLLFMGPFEANTVWEVEADGETPQHIEGVRRFLHRTWRLCEDAGPPSSVDSVAEDALRRAVARIGAAVTEKSESLQFNVAISELMACVSAMEVHRRNHGDTVGFREARTDLLKLLAPFAPFITEELWERLGMRAVHGSIHRASWPTWDPADVREDTLEMAILINSRVRDHITVPAGAGDDEVRCAALSTPAARAAMDGSEPRQVVVVPGRLVNIVTA